MFLTPQDRLTHTTTTTTTTNTRGRKGPTVGGRAASMSPPGRSGAPARRALPLLALGGLLLLAHLAGSLQPARAQLLQAELEAAQAAEQQPQQQEILVKPGSRVTIGCKLPQMADNPLRIYYWNFQRSAMQAQKPYIISYGSSYVDASTFGIQLDIDKEAGTYDLSISNVTYELNDGIYYCDYKDSSPESRQTINREYRLTVLIAPQAPTVVAQSPAPAREGQEYQLNCLSSGGNPEPNMSWFRADQPLFASPAGQPGAVRIEQVRANGTTVSSLSWIPTLEDNQAVYRCSVWNKAMSSLAAHERDYRVQVEYSPRIFVGPHNPLKVLQGAPIALTCQVDANPPVKGIRWFRDGHLLSNQFNHTISEAKLADSAVYSCQADNGIAPALVVGNQLAGLHGQVVGPASSFLSLFGLGPSSAADSQPGRSASAVEAQLHVQVLHAPRVQVRSSKLGALNEGDFVSLNCSVEASPAAHEIIWTKQEDPTFRRVSSAQNPSLEFQSVSAADMGNYTCTAFNRLDPSGYHQQLDKQGSASTLLLVRHKPGLAEISLGSGGETEQGVKTIIQCRARPPGYPEPQYKFWKFQGAGSQQRYTINNKAHGPTHVILQAKAEDEARYGCVAINEAGQSSEAEGELLVNEAPNIIQDSARHNEDVRMPGDSPYSITVRATGKPEPKVTWYHRSPIDGRRVELSAGEFQAKFKIETISKAEQTQHMRLKYTVISTLTFKNPLEVDDRGLYTVEFNNRLSRNAIQEFQLHINHSPIPAPKNQPIISSALASSGNGQQLQPTRTKAGFDPGETVNLTCRVSAYPKPDFLWYSISSSESDKPIDVNSRYRMSLTNPRDDIWEHTLTFSQAQESDYGEYLCACASYDPQTGKVGDSLRIFVDLLKKGAPDTPVQLEAVEATQDSIKLQWIPGFDGGFAYNQFLVQYAPDDGSGMSLSKRYPNADLLGSVMASNGYAGSNLLLDSSIDLSMPDSSVSQFPKLHDCLSMNPCTINNLSARQTYVFRLKAKNEFGSSGFSEEIRAMTRANVSQIPRILDASFDTRKNVLHFKLEPGSEYMLNNLNARIEVRSSSPAGANNQQQPTGPQDVSQDLGGAALGGPQQQQQQQQTQSGEWRLQSVVPMRLEQAQAFLDMSPDIEQLRITLCSRTNESLCGAEFVISAKSATSSYLHDQRGLSLSILISTLTLIVVLGAFATTVHTCCLTRKNKKAQTIERVEGTIDNKPIGNGAGNNHLHHQNGRKATSHGGSTTSTASTSANGASGLQSIDSINGAANGGAASDHSSDQSRQAKLDSMLPPNYNHYADRASVLMEQQQQQQQQMLMMQQQQHGMLSDKMGSAFGLPNSALLGVADQQTLPSPMMGANMAHFTYTQAQTLDQLDPMQQQASMSLDHHAALADTNGFMMGASAYHEDPSASMWPGSQQQSQPNDDYASYNPMGYSQQPYPDPMMDPTYGTTAMMSQPSTAYDDSANNNQFSTYMNAYQATGGNQEAAAAAVQYQQQAQYQQEIAAAQQQMYGTITRNGYSSTSVTNNTTSDTLNGTTSNSNNPTSDINKLTSQQNSSNQQQQLDQQQLYSTSNGLGQPMGQVGSQPAPVESDYGTLGGRSGRLIREIIV